MDIDIRILTKEERFKIVLLGGSYYTYTDNQIVCDLDRSKTRLLKTKSTRGTGGEELQHARPSHLLWGTKQT